MENAEAHITWETDYDTALQRARAEHKQILLYFHKPN